MWPIFATIFFEARGKEGWGANQGAGALQEHGSRDTRARGRTIEEALEGITQDVLEWDSPIPVAERRACIRSVGIEANDWLEEQSE